MLHDFQDYNTLTKGYCIFFKGLELSHLEAEKINAYTSQEIKSIRTHFFARFAGH